MGTRESLIEKRKKHLLATAAMYHKEPLHLVRAKGEYVFDSEGREYLDAIGGIVCISAGHNHPKIKAKLSQMLEEDEIQHTSLLYVNDYVVNAAEKLAKEAPEGLDKVQFTNSGSEANELAMMMSRHKTGESTVMSLQHGYHGGTSGVLAQCGHHNWRFRGQSSASVSAVTAPYCYRCPFQKHPDSCSLECAKQVETAIQTTTHGKIAAFIAEPVQGVGGFITPPEDYFHEVTKIVHNYGGAYISDEVQTGVGRGGGALFMTKDLGIDADIVTMAKGIGNGAPVGAVVAKEEYSESMRGKLYFNTFGGDPYQMAQTELTLDIIEEEKLVENARVMGARLKEGLKSLMTDHPLIGEVRGRGLLLGMELVKDRKTKEYATAETAELMDRMKDKGVLVGKGGLFGNVLRVAPPLSFTEKQIDKVVSVVDQALGEMR